LKGNAAFADSAMQSRFTAIAGEAMPGFTGNLRLFLAAGLPALGQRLPYFASLRSKP